MVLAPRFCERQSRRRCGPIGGGIAADVAATNSTCRTTADDMLPDASPAVDLDIGGFLKSKAGTLFQIGSMTKLESAWLEHLIQH